MLNEQVLSMTSVETAATSAAFFVRYHARTGLGAPKDVRMKAGQGAKQSGVGVGAGAGVRCLTFRRLPLKLS